MKEKEVYKYYFTFSHNHITKYNKNMRNSYVEVITHIRDGRKALDLFLERFSKIYMENQDMWSNQYSEQDFESKFYIEGNALTITE